MGLEINRLRDTKESGGMAEAKERIYETVDGRLVREGDPAGAFLAFAVGDAVPTDRAREYAALTESDGVTSRAYSDDDARELLRARQAGEPGARELVAHEVAGTPNAPVLMHDRLATELADEARSMANTDQALLSDQPAKWRVWRTEDGKLVHEGDPAASRLAYAPGDAVSNADADAYKAMGEPPSADDDATAGTTTADDTTTTAAPKSAAAPVNKAGTTSANKSR